MGNEMKKKYGGNCRGRSKRMERLIKWERWRSWGWLPFQTRIPNRIATSLMEIRRRNRFQMEAGKCGWVRLIYYLTKHFSFFLPLSQVFTAERYCLHRLIKSVCVSFPFCEHCWAFTSPKVRETFKRNGNEACCVS